ncbi:HNH endonuclease [Streptomyces brevispora]|uniref:HNH endonuclease n=1 Tax=Streptomyces brevispora TaxID=887462 RepID=UPI00371427B8
MAELALDISHFSDMRVRHTEERLRELVAHSTSVAEVVRRLGISPVGGNQAHIGRRITALRIDTSHFLKTPPHRPKGALGNRLTLGSPSDGRVSGKRLRRELVRSGIDDACALCGNQGWWMDGPIRLEVDHINGNWWDNRPENLRILCPNCHAITDTYRGRNGSGSA